MPRTTSIVFAACSIVLLLMLSACPPPLSPNVRREMNIVYGQGWVDDRPSGEPYLRDLRLDLITPTDRPGELKPAVLMIHGGSFEGGSKEDEDLIAFADRLATAGYVCFLMDYRLMGHNPPAPAPYSESALRSAAHAAAVDGKAAMRFIRANSSRYEVNPNRIAVFGESAGAIAGMIVAMTEPFEFDSDGQGYPIPEANNPEQNPTPQAVIEFWGSANEVLDEFDPGDPPVMIVHGVLDFTPGAFYADAVAIAEACEENNIPHTFITLLFEGHGAWDAEYEGADLATHTLDFLERRL